MIKYKRDIIFSYSKSSLLEYAPYFKIHKCPEDFPHPEWEYAHHPYFIDYRTQEIEQKTGVLEYSYNLSNNPNFDDFPKSPIPQFVSQHSFYSIFQKRQIVNRRLIYSSCIESSYHQ